MLPIWYRKVRSTDELRPSRFLPKRELLQGGRDHAWPTNLPRKRFVRTDIKIDKELSR